MTNQNDKLQELLEWINKNEENVDPCTLANHIEANDLKEKIQSLISEAPQVKLSDWQVGDLVEDNFGACHKIIRFDDLFTDNEIAVLVLPSIFKENKEDEFYLNKGSYVSGVYIRKLRNIDAERRALQAEIAEKNAERMQKECRNK